MMRTTKPYAKLINKLKSPNISRGKIDALIVEYWLELELGKTFQLSINCFRQRVYKSLLEKTRLDDVIECPDRINLNTLISSN